MSAATPNKKDAAPSKVADLTQRDLEILSKAWGAMKTQPEIDYEKLAEACGMTNPRSASNAWSMIKKKLFANTPDGAAKSETPAKKRKAPAKKTPAKDAAVKNEAADDDLEAEATPMKKARSSTKPKVKAAAKSVSKVKDEDSSADEKAKDYTPVKPEKTKPAKANTKAKKEPKSEEDSDGADADVKVAEAVDGEV